MHPEMTGPELNDIILDLEHTGASVGLTYAALFSVGRNSGDLFRVV
jgi:hypothetical protein